jgi:ferredoxin
MSSAIFVFLLAVISSQALILHNRSMRCNTALAADKTPLSANGKRLEFEPGSAMTEACTKLGVKVLFDCKKGNCGTCTGTVGGQKMRLCIGKVPQGYKFKPMLEKGIPITFLGIASK